AGSEGSSRITSPNSAIASACRPWTPSALARSPMTLSLLEVACGQRLAIEGDRLIPFAAPLGGEPRLGQRHPVAPGEVRHGERQQQAEDQPGHGGHGPSSTPQSTAKFRASEFFGSAQGIFSPPRTLSQILGTGDEWLGDEEWGAVGDSGINPPRWPRSFFMARLQPLTPIPGSSPGTGSAPSKHRPSACRRRGKKSSRVKRGKRALFGAQGRGLTMRLSSSPPPRFACHRHAEREGEKLSPRRSKFPLAPGTGERAG